VSESEIKTYLHSVLGSAPRPEWGLPDGWGAYLAELFSWALGRPIDVAQAKRCATRRPGMSWEADHEELHMLGATSSNHRIRAVQTYTTHAGLYPENWQLPLRLVEVRAAADDPVDAAEVLVDMARQKRPREDAGRRMRPAVFPRPISAWHATAAATATSALDYIVDPAMLGRASSRSLALNVQVMLGILAGRSLGAETGIDRTRVVCHLVRSNEALRASMQRLAFPQAFPQAIPQAFPQQQPHL
jgi:hypothetical protein